MGRRVTVVEEARSELVADLDGDVLSGLFAAAAEGVLRREGTSWAALPGSQGHRWNAVAVVADDDVWAVGTGGSVGRWDGRTFSQSLLPGVHYDLLDVVARPGEAWISAAGEELWHWDGQGFVREAWPALAGKRAGALHWASDRLLAQAHPMEPRKGSHVLVREGGTVADEVVQARGYGHLARLHGTGPADVWAAGMRGKLLGKGGALFRRDATGWREVALPVDRPLHAVWARARDEVWVGGERGTLLRFDGRSLDALDLGTRANVTGLCAPPGGPVLAVLDTRAIVRIEE